jgi:hypothetical protein
MAKKQIQIGLVYSAKVGGTFLPVRIDKSLGHGRYEGVVMPSGATVKFSTDSVKGDGETVEQWQARRKPKERDLPDPAPKATGKRKKSSQAEFAVTALIEPGAKTGKKDQGAVPAGDVGAGAKKATKPAKDAKDAKQRKPKADKPAKQRKPGGLDAAARVLREAGTAMNCGDIVKTALEKGYWQTGGKTPAATIYAAIITEIAKKGDASRFRKTERGHFELTAAGIAAGTAAAKDVE